MKNIVIIGAGMIAKSHATAIKSTANANLYAIVDIDELKAQNFAREYGCEYFTSAEDMLNNLKPDAVIICLPTFLHERYVSLCAQHKVNVLCEKPVEMTVEATEKMLNSVKKSGIIFMVAQVVRLWPGYVEIKEMADSGELGDIYMAYASRCSTMQTWGNTWLCDPNKGAGAIQDMHVHDIDFLRYLCGEFDTIYCLANKDYTGCYNHAMSSVAFKNGHKAVAEASFTMQEGYPFTMSLKIAATKASVEFYYRAGYSIGDRDEIDTELRIYRKGMSPVVTKPRLYDPYKKQLEYFLSCLENNEQPKIITPEQNLDVIKAVCAIRKSAETNEVIKIL